MALHTAFSETVCNAYLEMLEQWIQQGEINHNTIVEIGCGRGDIIGNLRYVDKVGFDINEEVIRAAKIFHTNTTFYVGSFPDVHIGEIEAIIMVNFIHEISPEKLKKLIEKMIENNKIRIFIIDILKHNVHSCYKYCHDGSYLLGGKGYQLIFSSREYKAADSALRHVEYWCRPDY